MIALPPFQAPINAQMLAQRQREILNQHLRQRQMHQQQQVQQRTLMMRGQGLNMTPSMVAPTGLPAAMSNPRIPQANAQQFPFPPNYGTGLQSPPLLGLANLSVPSPFSRCPLVPPAHSSLLAALGLVNQGAIGNLGGQWQESPRNTQGLLLAQVSLSLRMTKVKCVCESGCVSRSVSFMLRSVSECNTHYYLYSIISK